MKQGGRTSELLKWRRLRLKACCKERDLQRKKAERLLAAEEP